MLGRVLYEVVVACAVATVDAVRIRRAITLAVTTHVS